MYIYMYSLLGIKTVLTIAVKGIVNIFGLKTRTKKEPFLYLRRLLQKIQLFKRSKSYKLFPCFVENLTSLKIIPISFFIIIAAVSFLALKQV